MIRVVLMASGTGTNAINLLKFANENLKKVVICGLIVDRKSSPLLKMDLGIPVYNISKLKGEEISLHENRILKKINELSGDFIFLCGYMRMLSPLFLSHFPMKILNIHPSLLPKHKGAHAYQDAFDANDQESGITVHFVNEEMDGGEILLQESFPRLANDTIHDFIERGKKLEWELYPKALLWLENGHEF